MAADPSWRDVWRRGLSPSLPTEGLEALREALAKDDPRLLQGATCSPPPLAVVHDWPLEAADPIAFCAWQAGYADTVAQADEFFARACFDADQRMGEPAAVRWWLTWWDEGPRSTVIRLMFAEVSRTLAERILATVPDGLTMLAAADDCPAMMPTLADWLRDRGHYSEADAVAELLR